MSSPDFQQIAPISRALALEQWELAFTLMDELVGYELAGAWLAVELELAGWHFERDGRTRRTGGPHYGAGR
jgi:hypothetical protein